MTVITNEGPTSKKWSNEAIWLAGNQLGNQVKTNNAQIRVTAYYGAASGWDGYDPFHQETYGGPQLVDINDATGAYFWDATDPLRKTRMEKRRAF